MRKGFTRFPMFITALVEITSLGAKCTSRSFLEKSVHSISNWQPSLPFWRWTIYDKSISKMIRAMLTPWLGLVIILRCQSRQKNSFQAMHLAPTEFSGQFSQSTNDSEANKHHRGISLHPALRKIRSRLQRTSLIQKREKLPNISDTEDQRAFVLPHSNETTDDNREQTSMISLLRFF